MLLLLSHVKSLAKLAPHPWSVAYLHRLQLLGTSRACIVGLQAMGISGQSCWCVEGAEEPCVNVNIFNVAA